MKKSVVKFLAAGLAALSLMGTTAAINPASTVFAAETSATASEESYTVENIEKKQVLDKVNYMKWNYQIYEQYDNNIMFVVGDQIYSYTMYDAEPELINGKDQTKYQFLEKKSAEAYIENHMVYDATIEEIKLYHYDEYIGSDWAVVGKLPKVNLATRIYNRAQVESIHLSASRTMIHPGDCVTLHADMNKGADDSLLTWELWGVEGAAELQGSGTDAFLTGLDVGTVMIDVSAPNGVHSYVTVDVVDWDF